MVIKEEEPKIKILAHEFLACTLSYLMLTPWWYSNSSILSLHNPLMLRLVFLCFSYYRFDLLPRYEPVHLRATVGYVQTISNVVAQASPRLVIPLISRVCHPFGHDLVLCYQKRIVACASQLHLVVGHVAF
jgi:hypothetical protein